MREEATSLHGTGPPPGRVVRACGHLVRLPDSVFVRGTPSGLKKIIIYTLVWSDPCITQISFVFRFEPVFCRRSRSRCLLRIQRGRAMWLITFLTPRSMGTWNHMARPLMRKRTMIPRGRNKQVPTKRRLLYLNLDALMWSSRSQASLTKGRSLRPCLSLLVSCRRVSRNFAIEC